MEALEGVYVVVVTPIDSTQRIDKTGLSRNVRWLAEQGVLSLKSLWAELAHVR